MDTVIKFFDKAWRFGRIASLILILTAAGLGEGNHAYGSDRKTVVIYNLLSHPILDQSIAGIKEALREEVGKDMDLKISEVNANAQFNLLNAYAKEILANAPTVIVPISTPGTQAVAKEAPPEQAIVFSTVTNPNDVGMNTGPKNMTGVSDAVNYGANLDLIKIMLPKARRIGLIYNAGERNSQFGVEQVERLAPSRDLMVSKVTVSNSNEVADAARALAKTVDVIYVGSDNTVVGAIDGLIAVAEESRVPVIASDVGSVEKGALAAISVDYHELGRAVGKIVAEILRTKKEPGTIKNVIFEGRSLILNAKTATRIGYKFSDLLRALSTRIIE